MSGASTDVATANALAARELVGGLVAGGVLHAVLSPGSRSTPLVLALHRLAEAGKVRLFTVLDERSAAFFALGSARVSRAPTLLVATSGSAGAHYLPAIIEAAQSGVPLIALTADRPLELHGAGAPQTVPQGRLFEPHVKATIELAAPSHEIPVAYFATHAARAMLSARTEPTGPVHVNVPFREPLWRPGAEPESPLPSRAVTAWPARRSLDPTKLSTLARELKAKERGAIVVGPQDDPELVEPLTQLARRLSWPVLAEATSQLRFAPHDRGNLITRYDAILRSAQAGERLAPEVVLKLGQTLCSRPLNEWLERFAPGRTIAVIPPGGLSDPSHLASVLVPADGAELMRGLLAELEGEAPRPSSWLEAWQEADRIAKEVLGRPAEQRWEGAIAADVAAALPEGSLVHLGNGMPIRDFDAFAPASPRDIRVLANRGANGIDGTTSTVVGEAIAGGRPAVALIGDLAALHDLSGLRLAGDLGAQVVLVVVDNHGGGIFDFLPIAAHPTAYEAHFSAPQRADIGKVALSLGLELRRVDAETPLGPAVEQAIAAGAPSILHVPVDRAVNVAIHRQRWNETAAALDAWALGSERSDRRTPW